MNEILNQLSQAMADLVEQAGRSVVRVEARQRMPATGVVYSADGVIITSHHGVELEEGIKVGLADGRSVAARLVGRDPNTDLAVLRAEATGLTPAAWIDAADLRVGNLALALGRPGKSVQATLGVVSALGGAWRTGVGGEIDRYLQTDVVMYPGFSGGPLVEASGKFAGINSSALARGVSVTIPAATVRRVVDTLLAHGSVPRGYLGIGIQPVRLAEPLQKAAGQETGLMVMSVEAGGPAERASITQGDVLISLDNEPMRHLDELQAALRSERVGKSVSVQIARSGSLHTLQVTVGSK
jgi:S1-C subfamily serine protease